MAAAGIARYSLSVTTKHETIQAKKKAGVLDYPGQINYRRGADNSPGPTTERAVTALGKYTRNSERKTSEPSEPMEHWERSAKLQEEGIRRIIDTCHEAQAAIRDEIERYYGPDPCRFETVGDLALMLQVVIAETVDDEIWLDYIAELAGDIRDAVRSGPDGFVYVLNAGSFYKIGRTRRLDKRIKTLEIQLPWPVTVVAAIPCEDATKAERYLHGVFSKYRSNGEWFQLPDNPVPKIGIKWLKSIRYMTVARSREFASERDTEFHTKVPKAIRTDKRWAQAFDKARVAVEVGV